MRIQNGELLNAVKEEIKIQGMEFPSELQNVVVPVYPLLPRSKTKARQVSTTGDVTIITAPNAQSQKKLYITSVAIAYTKDVVCDNTGLVIQVYQDNAAQTIISQPLTTTLAQTGNMVITFNTPIVIDVGTAVTLIGTFTAGTMTKFGSITYFLL